MAKWSCQKWLIWGFSVWHQYTPVQRLGRQKWHGVFCSWWELSDQPCTWLGNDFCYPPGLILGREWVLSIEILTKNDAWKATEAIAQQCARLIRKLSSGTKDSMPFLPAKCLYWRVLMPYRKTSNQSILAASFCHFLIRQLNLCRSTKIVLAFSNTNTWIFTQFEKCFIK